MTPTLFPEPAIGDHCDWRPAKLGKHSRLHIIMRRLAVGRHPLDHAELANNGETCATCSHKRLNQRGQNRWWKCNQVEMTHGPGSDIRLKWPACMRWGQGVSTDNYSLATGRRR